MSFAPTCSPDEQWNAQYSESAMSKRLAATSAARPPPYSASAWNSNKKDPNKNHLGLRSADNSQMISSNTCHRGIRSRDARQRRDARNLRVPSSPLPSVSCVKSQDAPRATEGYIGPARAHRSRGHDNNTSSFAAPIHFAQKT